MKYLIFVFLIFSTSAGFGASWDKTVLTGYGKAPSYKELFCAKSPKGKSCLYYKKQLGKVFWEKPLQISMTDEDTVWIHTKISQIKLVKESEGKFLINGHAIDLAQVDSRDELRSLIRKSLPRRTAGLMSFWISSAWAAGLQLEDAGVLDLQVVASIDHLIVLSRKLSTCDEIEAFVNLCSDAEPIGRALGQTEVAWKGFNAAEKKAQIKVVNEYLQGLKKLTSGITKKIIGEVNSTITSCSLKDPAMPTLFKECIADLKDTSKALKIMNDKMAESASQLANEVEEEISTLAESDGWDEEHEGMEDLQYAPIKAKTKTSSKTKNRSGTQ